MPSLMHAGHARASTLTGLAKSAMTYMYTLSVLPYDLDLGSSPLYAVLTVLQHLEIYGYIYHHSRAALVASPKPSSFGDKFGC